MEDKDLQKLERLHDALNLVSGDKVTVDEVAEVVEALIQALKSTTDTLQNEFSDSIRTLKETFTDDLNDLSTENTLTQEEVNQIRGNLNELMRKFKEFRLQEGKPGKDSDPIEVARIIVGDPNFLERVKGDDGSPDTPEQIRDKHEKLEDDNRLDKSAVKGLEKFDDNTRAIEILDQRTQYLLNKPSSTGGGTVQTIVAGDGISVDSSDPANPIVSSTGEGTGDMLAATYDPQNIEDDAFDRANHTGEQAISTITGLQAELDDKEPARGADDNYVTDAEKVVIGNTSGTNTGDQDLSGYQLLDADLTAIAGLSPSNDDVIQRKAGAWTNRTMAQVKTDLALVKGDVGLGNVDNTSDATKNAAAVALTNKDLTSGTNTFPTFNQNTTGSAATLTTTRTIWGQNFNGSANVTGTLALGASDLTLTGSIGATGARATKVWTAALESTAMPTVGGTAILTSLTSPQFTTIELGAASDTTLSRVSAGVVAIEGANILVSGGALGTPSSGTLTNVTGLPISGITSSTSTALGVGSLELGHASDTTLSRSAAGVLAVEGVVIPSITSTNTLTNKRITKRTGTTTSSATPTINTDNVDFYSLTAQTADITSFTTNLSGTPTEGQILWIAITGTAARAITWGASFEASTVALPTTTVSTNRLDVGFVWNTVTSKWRCVASA